MGLKRNFILFLLSVTILFGTVPPVVAAQPVKNPNPFAFDNIKEVVAQIDTQYIKEKLCSYRRPYELSAPYKSDSSPFEKAINALPKLTEAPKPSTSALIARVTAHSFVSKTNRYVDHTYELRKNTLRFERKEFSDTGKILSLTKSEYKLSVSQYNQLLKALEETKNSDAVYAEWLYTVSFDHYNDIVCRDGSKVWNESEIDPYAQMNLTRNTIPQIEVVPGSLKTYKPGVAGRFPKAVEVQLVMGKNLPIVTIAIDGDKLYIERSDRKYVCAYTLVNAADTVAEMRELFNTPPDEEPDEAPPDDWGGNQATGKPVIYLYPEKEQKVSVKLTFDGDLTYTYPAYNNGWNVTAYPDGRIINGADQSEHNYLFWEGISQHKWNFDSGFVVAGKDIERFLKEKLSYMGLIPQEYNDFITYWAPQMHGNPYNLISFSAIEEYAQVAKLEISPKPDRLLRIHMAWKAIDTPVKISEQQLKTFTRKGFTVVEWGGTEVK